MSSTPDSPDAPEPDDGTAPDAGASAPPPAEGHTPPPPEDDASQPAEGYAAPSAGEAPAEGYAAPSAGEAPAEGYAPPPEGYAPPPEGYAPPPGYASPQGYAPMPVLPSAGGTRPGRDGKRPAVWMGVLAGIGLQIVDVVLMFMLLAVASSITVEGDWGIVIMLSPFIVVLVGSALLMISWYWRRFAVGVLIVSAAVWIILIGPCLGLLMGV